MTHILIPRAATCSAKVVSTLDFEKYWSCDIIFDYIKSGFTVAAQCPNILAVDVTTGIARLKGLYIENTVADTITCLTVCATNSLYLTVNRNCCCIPKNWTYSTNTTGCVPTDSQLFATATTNCATVTSVCNVPSGREIIPNPFPNLDKIFGCGEDGCACNPVDASCMTRSYKNLTFSCSTIWNNIGTSVIRVSCTLTIDACITWTFRNTLNTNSNKEDRIGFGGCGGTSPASPGGDGGNADASLVIFAKTVAGTGTITIDSASSGLSGTGGAGGPSPSTPGEFSLGRDFSGVPFIEDYMSPTTTSRIKGLDESALINLFGQGGRGGTSGLHPAAPPREAGGGGGGGATAAALLIVTENDMPSITIISTGGTGGNGGCPSFCVNNGSGGAGGVGGSLPWVSGGGGGSGGPPPTGAGGGGGGGGAAGVFVISSCDSSVTYTLTGGAGGTAGAGASVGTAGGTGVLTMTFNEFQRKVTSN